MTDSPTKKTAEPEDDVPRLPLAQITEGETDRGIPLAKFMENVDAFASSFTPPASSDSLILAYTELKQNYRMFEARLTQKRELKIMVGVRV